MPDQVRHDDSRTFYEAVKTCLMRQKQDTHRDRLIVFGRYPVPGQTKTRLIPLLGAARAADFQRVLAERTVRTDRAFVARQGTALEACFEGCNEKKLRRWLGSGLIFSTQCAGDLGQRMETACQGSLSGRLPQGRPSRNRHPRVNRQPPSKRPSKL